MGGVVGAVGRTLDAATPRVRQVIDADRHAMDNYVPRPYPGSAAILLCSEAPSRTFYDGRLGVGQPRWQGGLMVRFIPGDHDTMLDEPIVAGVAAALDRCLNREEDCGALASVSTC